MDVLNEKKMLREKIWKLLEEKGVVRFPVPCFGRIPNFEGSDKAAENLAGLNEWKKAKTIFSNPDFAQHKIRELALKDKKTLIMASPRLKKGYLIIKPEHVRGKERVAATIKGAFKFGKEIEKLPKADLVITGCVAVDQKGFRLGKGGGYGDKEISRLKKEKLISSKTQIITSVHDLQIVKKVPVLPHDQKVDIIVTPTKVIRCE